MTYEEKLVWYGTSRRATATTIHQFSGPGKKLTRYWVGKLRGRIVSTAAGFKFDSKVQALNNARNFRESARKEAAELGLLK